MASSGGGGGGDGDVPAEWAAAAVKDLLEAREGAARLRGLLQEQQSSTCAELMDGMLNKLSSALSALDTAARASAVAGDGVTRQTAVGGRTRKRSFGGRSQRPSDQRVAATLVDGHIWRKYGQKEIQNSPHPRSYYRCTHKSDQGCNAKRHVHVCETDPSKYAITYYGEHTCRDPSTIPPITVDAIGMASDDRANNLISFSPRYAAGAGASSQLAVDGGATATRLSSSWTCTSELSSSPETLLRVDDELAAVVGSAGMTASTVGTSAPEYGGLGGTTGGDGGAGSFPSSPSSIGFVARSLGSMGDDDFFPFDPWQKN